MKIINKRVVVSHPLIEERGFFCNENDMKAAVDRLWKPVVCSIYKLTFPALTDKILLILHHVQV